jgi:hypothetical protein
VAVKAAMENQPVLRRRGLGGGRSRARTADLLLVSYQGELFDVAHH